MEPENSVVLEACTENSVLIQTVKNIVTQSADNELEGEGFFLVTDVEGERQEQMEVALADAACAVTQTDSQIKKITLSDLCRICANISDHMIPIFEGEGLQHELCNKIHKYLPIHITQRDILPLQLCYHCAATLLAWTELVEGCLGAERRLLEMQETLHSKNQYTNVSNGAVVHVQMHVPEHNAVEAATVKDSETQDSSEPNGGTVALHSDRSSTIRIPFKVLLDTQSEFWKPYRKKYQPVQVKSTVEADGDSVWITVLDASSLEEPVTIADTLPSNDLECKEENTEEGKGDRGKISRVEACKEPTKNAKHDGRKTRSQSKPNPDNVKVERDTCEEIKVQRDCADVQESFQCVECGKCFKLKDSYARHMRIHRDERPFTCHICGKQFRDSGGLSRHLKDVHAKVKNFTCDICGRPFASKATRDDHRRTHTGERPYICDSCGKTFKSKASLYIHNKLHTDEFPHACSYCAKKFRRRQEMLAHVTTHTGEKNYECDVCTKRFRVKSELVRHKLIHSESKPFVCVKCGLAFRQKRYLNNHVKSRHVEAQRAC
ncbi:hypothetical protein KM043_000622 [Ampulex compressa]|nr:hypothetical protein KM043_000622 [Ampulex compressa]